MAMRRPSRRLTGLTAALIAVMTVATVAVWAWADDPDGDGVSTAAPTTTAATRTVPSHAAQQTGEDRTTVRRHAYPATHADPSQNYGDLHLPADYRAHRDIPLVILVHGGGWGPRITARVLHRLAADLAAQGVAAYSIEYRRVGTGGGWPTTFTDVAAAFDDVPALLTRYPQIRKTGVTAFGHSAGAQLAVWASLRSAVNPGPGGHPPRMIPDRVISVAGPLDMTWAAATGNTRAIAALGGRPTTVPDHYAQVDPVLVAATHPLPSRPTITVLHGDADRLVPPDHARRFAAAYSTTGGRIDVRILPRQSHASMLRPDRRAYRDLLHTVVTRTRR